jgi:hypothetical protein
VDTTGVDGAFRLAASIAKEQAVVNIMAVQQLLLLPVGTADVNKCDGDLLSYATVGTMSGWDGSADPISTTMTDN